jgi:hypothetical protein
MSTEVASAGPDKHPRRIAAEDAPDAVAFGAELPDDVGDEFGEEAVDELRHVVRDFLSDLLNAVYRETRRSGADRVTATYVKRAARDVYQSRRNVMNTSLGTFGGILLGAGVSVGLGWLSGTTKVEPQQAFAVLVVGLMGTAALVAAVVRGLME